MDKLSKQLIELGHKKPELRDHLRKILDKVASHATRMGWGSVGDEIHQLLDGLRTPYGILRYSHEERGGLHYRLENASDVLLKGAEVSVRKVRGTEDTFSIGGQLDSLDTIYSGSYPVDTKHVERSAMKRVNGVLSTLLDSHRKLADKYNEGLY